MLEKFNKDFEKILKIFKNFLEELRNFRVLSLLIKSAFINLFKQVRIQWNTLTALRRGRAVARLSTVKGQRGGNR